MLLHSWSAAEVFSTSSAITSMISLGMSVIEMTSIIEKFQALKYRCIYEIDFFQTGEQYEQCDVICGTLE